MSLIDSLSQRSESKCELCDKKSELSPYQVNNSSSESADENIAVCETCLSNMNESSNANYWRCLNDTMWTQVPVVQVAIWRVLNSIKSEGWPMNMLDMIYLKEDTLKWAKEGSEDESTVKHKDSNGVLLSQGDSVVLIKDLNVKGAGFTAKRGTAVRNINLVHDNPEHIEGRVNDQQIVILTQYVKKNN
ncbi:MAG: PhnA domain-containing protein [Flavobacteriales bacterium]|nr:PhnA domain-containing protein [Flavobacteriales bacterium]